MTIFSDDLENTAHGFTSCTDEDLNNLGYCTRCNTIAFLQRERYRDALEKIAFKTRDYAPTLQSCQSIATEALK